MQGTIIKGIGGFYYVKTNTDIIECKARGNFRYKDYVPMVGDNVDIVIDNGKGRIEKIHERSTKLIRPAVANVTQAFLVFAIKNPDINEDLLNKFLIICEYNKLKVVVCFNKLDLADEVCESVVNMTQKAGYEVMFLKAKEGAGIEELREKLKNNITVFCGPSGVGKSTILNKLAGVELMETGDISERLQRGKHTTRHSQLIDIGDGLVVDTPGFSMVDIDFIQKDELQYYFPEFKPFIGNCKFSGCVHDKEPGCSIKEGVSEGTISKERYDFYIKTLNSLKMRRNRK